MHATVVAGMFFRHALGPIRNQAPDHSIHVNGMSWLLQKKHL